MRGRSILGAAIAVAVAAIMLAFWLLRGDELSASTGLRTRNADPGAPALAASATARDAADRATTAASDAAPDSLAPVRTSETPESPARPLRRVFGLVVDGRRQPVANARLVLILRERLNQTTRSGADGRYEFKVEGPAETEWLTGSIRGEAGDGAVGVTLAYLPGEQVTDGFSSFRLDCEAATLVLLPAAVVHVHVVDEQGPVAGASVSGNSSELFRPMRFDVATSDGHGAATLRMPQTDAWITATSSGGSAASRESGRTWTTCESGREQSVELRLHPIRNVTVRVVDADSRAAIAGARLDFGERVLIRMGSESLLAPVQESFASGHLPPVFCDDLGVAELDDVDPEAGRSLVTSARGYDSDRRRSFGESDVVEVALHRLAAQIANWKIEPGELPVPPDGTVVTLKEAQIGALTHPPASGRVEGGELEVVRNNAEWFEAIATTADHGVARVSTNGQGESKGPIHFDRARALTVALRHPDGTPAAGAPVQLRDLGNNAITPVRTTDDRGEARFDALLHASCHVCASEEEVPGSLPSLGQTDLADDDGRFDGVVAAACDACLEVTLDGVRGLPPSYHVTAPYPVARVVGEEPATGVVHLRIACDPAADHVTLYLNSRDYLASSFEVPIVRNGAPPHVAVELRRGATLVARVAFTADQRVEIVPERQEADGHFEPLSLHQKFSRPSGPEGSFLFSPLNPGTWRLRDGVTGQTSPPVAIASGERCEVDLDLERRLRVRGRVVAPKGTDLSKVRLLVGSGEGTLTPDELGKQTRRPGFGVGDDGTFEVTLGARDPFLRAWHPKLSPPDRAPVRVNEDGAYVELVLVQGPLLRFDALLPTGAAVTHGTIDVWFKSPRATQGRLRLAHAEADGVSLSEPPIGTFTLLFDAGGPEAPLELNEVAIPAEGRDLGELRFTSGASLDVTLASHAGEAATDLVKRVIVEARQVDFPHCTRRVQGGESGHVVLHGLGRGSYEVTLRRRGDLFNDTELWKRVLDFDGQSSVAVAVDLH